MPLNVPSSRVDWVNCVFLFCITALALVAAGPLIRLLGDKVEAVITRLLGVLLAALATQYVIDGLRGAFFS